MPQKAKPISPAAAVSIEAWTERVITEREVSMARARQLRWVAGELALVATTRTSPSATPPPAPPTCCSPAR